MFMFTMNILIGPLAKTHFFLYIYIYISRYEIFGSSSMHSAFMVTTEPSSQVVELRCSLTREYETSSCSLS